MAATPYTVQNYNEKAINYNEHSLTGDSKLHMLYDFMVRASVLSTVQVPLTSLKYEILKN